MPVSTESRNVLEEMRRAGVDATILAGLERELDSKPEVEKVVKNGILAQSSFNDYRTKKDQEVAQLRSDLQNLAALQASSGNLSGDLKTQVEAQITAKKEELASKGYDVEQVTEFVNDLLANPANISKLNSPPEKKDPVMPNNNNGDPNKQYVDTKTFTNALITSSENMARGNIHMAAYMARALREADRLGIELPEDKLNGFSDAVISGLEAKKNPDVIMDEYFGFSVVKEANNKKQREAELVAAKEEGRREALKEAGANPRGRFRDPQRNPNPILDRQNRNNDEKLDSRIKDVKDLPKNEKGDPEYFRMRRFDPVTRRHEHTQNAVNRFSEVSREYDDDGLFIGHRQNQSA